MKPPQLFMLIISGADDQYHTAGEGRQGYRAPECIGHQAQKYDCKCDIWSCGLTLIEFLTGTYLFIWNFIYLLKYFNCPCRLGGVVVITSASHTEDPGSNPVWCKSATIVPWSMVCVARMV